MFFPEEMHWHVWPREVKFSRRSRSHASGEVLAAKKKVASTFFGSTRLGAARRDGSRESLRGKRVRNFLYNGRGKETR